MLFHEEINMAGNCTGTVSVTEQCIPNWLCEQPLNGYMVDGCGNRKADSSCNPPPPLTSIIISSTPPGAEIYFNGSDQGQVTPYTFTNYYTAGQLTVTLTLSGYQSYTQYVNITPGVTTTISVSMVPLSSINQICYRGAVIYYGVNSVISSPVWTYCVGASSCDFAYQSANNINPQGANSIEQMQLHIDALIALGYAFSQC